MFSTFCSTDGGFPIFSFLSPLRSDARLPDVTSRKTRQLIGTGWLTNHDRRLCSIKAVRSLYKLTGRHRASAAAAVGPFFPSTTQSVPVPLTYDHTRWLRLLHNAWDPPYMHSYMCDKLACGCIPAEMEKPDVSDFRCLLHIKKQGISSVDCHQAVTKELLINMLRINTADESLHEKMKQKIKTKTLFLSSWKIKF